ncbi:hypothetical protein B9Z65_1118 [Elsinoe australis]|uniref:VOC domain-containing protein n=1 Tax=Elsinoe australis TaxID=40998 RepID=A0A2P8AIB6_9PEZI|nr:hypothetical protein B9Z65_1118 [Elsinoe australis]
MATSESFKILGYGHTGITVRSIKDSIRFWNEILGLPVLFQATLTGVGTTTIPGAPAGSAVHIAFIGLPQTPHAGGVTGNISQLELVQFELPENVSQEEKSRTPNSRSWDVGATHIAFFVEGLDQVVEKVKQEKWGLVGGVYTMGEVDPPPIRGQRVCYIRGPDGETVELIELPKKEA